MGTDQDPASTLELCVEALGNGTARGVSPSAPPDEALARLGPEFAENRNQNVMWRDFGMVECHYERSSADRPWRGAFLMVQAHRLDRPVQIADVLAQLHRYGHELLPEPYDDPDFRLFRASVSTATALVAGSAGRVEKISAAAWPVPRWPSLLESQWISARDTLKNLLAQAIDQRSVANDRLAGLFGPLEALMRAQPQRASEWFSLGLWLFDRAFEAGLWPAEQTAIDWVSFVGRHIEAADEPARHVAERRCRELRSDHVDLDRDWRELDPGELRRRRLDQYLQRIARATDLDGAL